MRCHACESKKHFIAECPHRQVENSNVTVHLTLVAGVSTASDIRDSLGKEVLDTACTKSVAGQVWLDAFIETMEEMKEKI